MTTLSGELLITWIKQTVNVDIFNFLRDTYVTVKNWSDDMTIDQIVWRNQTQHILWMCELKGQVSDGFWDNSRPYHHWEVPCKAQSVVNDGTKELGPNFSPIKKYSFDSAELVDVVGTRMINFVKVYIAFPHLNPLDHWDYDMDGVDDYVEQVIDWVNNEDGFFQEKAIRIFKAFNVEYGDITSLHNTLKAVNNIQFTLDDLKKELKDMTRIFKRKQYTN